MKRVLYVECNEDGTAGGSHKILADLVTRLSPAYQPVVLFYQDNFWVERLRKTGIEVCTWDAIRFEEGLRFQSGGKLTTLWTLIGAIARRRRFLRDMRVDLIHLNNSPVHGYDDWLPAAMLTGIPCATYAMGNVWREPNPLRRGLMQRFDMVFPLSRHVEGMVAEHVIGSDRIELTYPGVDVDEVQARIYRPIEEVRAEFEVMDDQVLAIMVGNIREWKGQHVVIEALGALTPDRRARLVLLMVGDIGTHHKYEARLRTMLAERGLENGVRLTGLRSDVSDLFRAADIAIHASVDPEPFGLVVLEAMLHGCAPVAANIGGPMEMLTPECGLTYDTSHPKELAAHLTRLLDDPELRETLGARARIEALRFDIGTHVALIEEVYDRLLN